MYPHHLILFVADAGNVGKGGHNPFFKCNAVLTIPTISMQPALDEVQQAVNKAAQMIINTAKGVSQWSKERKKVPPSAISYYILYIKNAV